MYVSARCSTLNTSAKWSSTTRPSCLMTTAIRWFLSTSYEVNFCQGKSLSGSPRFHYITKRGRKTKCCTFATPVSCLLRTSNLLFSHHLQLLGILLILEGPVLDNRFSYTLDIEQDL